MAKKRSLIVRLLITGVVGFGLIAFGFGAGAVFGGVTVINRGHVPWLYDSAVALGRQEAQKPEGRNAAVLYWKFWFLNTEFDDDVRELMFLEVDPADPAQPDAATLARLELGSVQWTVAQFIEYSGYEHCDFEIQMEQGFEATAQHLGFMRNTFRLLMLDAYRCALAGESEAAVERLVAGLNIGRQLEDDGLLISSQVSMRIAGDVIRWTQRIYRDASLDEADARVLAEAMRARAASDFATRSAIEGEKLMGAVNIALVSRKDEDTPAVTEFGLLSTGRGEELHAEMSRYFDAVLAVWDRPDCGEELAKLTVAAEAGEYGTGPQILAGIYLSAWTRLEETRLALSITADDLEGAATP